MEKPQQRPEGKLIGERIKGDPDLSIRKVAERVGLSEARVRQIINGYASAGRGQQVDVLGPSDTVTNIALAAGITPEEMELADRSDVAHSMRVRASESQKPGGGWPEMLDYDEIRSWAEEPFTMMPPAMILGLFDIDALVAEVDRRLHVAQRILGTDYWDARWSDEEVRQRVARQWLHLPEGSSQPEKEGTANGTAAQKIGVTFNEHSDVVHQTGVEEHDQSRQ